jgi:hypothetical protein
VVLRFAQLHQQLPYLVLNLHLLQDGGSIVRCTQRGTAAHVGSAGRQAAQVGRRVACQPLQPCPGTH